MCWGGGGFAGFILSTPRPPRTGRVWARDSLRGAITHSLTHSLTRPRRVRQPHQHQQSLQRAQFLPSILRRFQKRKMFCGHLSYSLYCIVYDRSNRRIITAADDRIVKIWSARSGHLLHTLRGHNAEVTDICTCPTNKRLLACCCCCCCCCCDFWPQY